MPSIYENNTKIPVSKQLAAAMRALAVGYNHIQAMHAVLLGTYGFCFKGISGYELTTAGRRCLEAWEAGDDYDCTQDRRRHRHQADIDAEPIPGASA